MKNSNLRIELIKAYKSMGKQDLKFLEEWELYVPFKTANYKYKGLQDYKKEG